MQRHVPNQYRQATIAARSRSFIGFKRLSQASRRFLADLGFAVLPAAALLAPILVGTELPRQTLWSVLQTCAFVNAWAGHPFPCLALHEGAEGFAVIRAPWSRKHVIVTPTIKLTGLESPEIGSLSTAFWRAALDARGLIRGAGGSLPPGKVALSINPKRSRSQDQFHIHVDCASPALFGQLRSQAAAIGPTWAKLPKQIEDSIYWARRVRARDAAGANALLSVRELPTSVDRADIVFGVVNLSEDGVDDFVHLVSNEKTSAAEDLLDVDCATTR